MEANKELILADPKQIQTEYNEKAKAITVMLMDFQADYTIKAQILAAEVKNITVNSKPTYDKCLAKVDETKILQKEIKGFIKPFKDLAHKVWKTFCKIELDTLSPFVTQESNTKQKAGKWFLEEQRKAEERARKERERLAGEAEEKAQKERERLAKEAAEKQIEEAKKLFAEGDGEEAEKTLERPVEVPDVIPDVVPRVEVENRAAGAGFSMVDNWKAIVIDIDELTRQYMLPDMETLNRMAKALKGKNPPAGVQFVNEAYAKKASR